LIIETKKLNYLKRGDIVVARSPWDPKQLICKRIVGVSGDNIKQGFLSQQMVPRGHVWLQGDNVNDSKDSRDFGAVPIGLILGKVIFKVYQYFNFIPLVYIFFSIFIPLLYIFFIFLSFSCGLTSRNSIDSTFFVNLQSLVVKY
jgi:signal peptidase I